MSPNQGIPNSASLLRRLVEAADGYRTGEPVWLVAYPNFPHKVLGAYPDHDSATAARDEHAGSEVYGPFQTAPDFDLDDPLLIGVWRTPWTYYGFHRSVRLDEVDKIRITIKLKNGPPIDKEFPPDEVEAFFFSMGAVDRFLIPFYSRVYGPHYAAQVRDEIEADAGRDAAGGSS
jgi:hypothetical protein